MGSIAAVACARCGHALQSHEGDEPNPCELCDCPDFETPREAYWPGEIE